MLYRLAVFFEHQETGLLPGQETPEFSFNNITVVRAMDAEFAAGAVKVFSAVRFGLLAKGRGRNNFPL